MRKLCLLIFILTAQLIIISWEDNVPTDRPTFSNNNDSLINDNDIDEEEEQEPEVIRPSGAVIIQPDYCGCKNGEPITIGDCAAICSNSQDSGNGQEQLFFNVELTTAITLDIYEDVFGWCNQEINENETDVRCAIEVKSESGNLSEINFTPSPGVTSFTTDISGLSFDETFRLTLVEKSSGARSTTFQVRKFSELRDPRQNGPLQLMPVNRYACMIVNGGATSEFQDSIQRFHLFFNSETRPEPLQETTVGSFFCHDKGIYGTTPINSPLLEETTGVFTLWYKDDPRFFSLDGDQIMDINQIIEQEVNLQGASLPETPELFVPLEWQSAFDDGDSSPGSDASGGDTTVTVVNKELGFYMAAFIDEDNNFTSYCPTRDHYYSSSPFFKAMREVIAVDTEALYIAKQNNVCDFILVNESVVSDIWFYTENGQHIQPNSQTIRGKQIQFYWPADPSSPFIKKSHQRVYTIKSVSELSGGSCNNTVTTEDSSSSANGVRTVFPRHDKRIGCIPVLSE